MSAATLLASRTLRSVAAQVRVAPRRFAHSAATGGAARKSALMMAAVGVAGAAGSYAAYSHLKWGKDLPGLADILGVQSVAAASAKYPPSQASVFSPTKEHALYLWIHLSPKADAKKCAKVVADIQAHADAVSPADLRDEDNEILAGVGFGPDFYSKVAPSPARQNYSYKERKGTLGAMPAGGGDIFIHAKSNNTSKLFELAQRILASLPAGSVAKFEDVYSFVYRNGRDLSGFIDGTENPADEDDRQNVAVEIETGGSYVITQKWIHHLDRVITAEKPATMEKWVGRSIEDSVELKNKPVSSHVARMTGGTGLNQVKPFQIVRQSMPYGNLHDHAGLFFIAYAASPANFNYMLDRMVGVDTDGHSDDVMRLSQCVASTYWYFPGLNELKKMK